MAEVYDVWSPENIKRFQADMKVAPIGSKYSGVVGPKTKAAMGTEAGAKWLLNDYNKGLAASMVPTSVSSGSVTPVKVEPTALNSWADDMNKAIVPVEAPTVLAGGTGTYGMYNNVGIDKDAYNAIADSGITEGLYKGAGNSDGLAGMLSGIGGAKGFADLAGGLSSLGSLYMGYKQNKLAEDAHNAKMAEYNRQVNRDKEFAKNIKASGLGTYSA